MWGVSWVRELLALGERVRVVDTLWFGNPFPPHDRLEVIQGDLRFPEASWLEGIDGIVHLAAFKRPDRRFRAGAK